MKERLPQYSPDPDLFAVVMVRDKKSGQMGLMPFFNEEEVDKRIAFLDREATRCPDLDYLRQAHGELKEFHQKRRESWETLKDKVEIILLPR